MNGLPEMPIGGMMQPPLPGALQPMPPQDVQPVGQIAPTSMETLDEPDIRGKLEDWDGGKPVDLEKSLKSGKKLKEELSSHLKETLDLELQNQSKLIDRLKRWHRLYKAEGRGARPKPWMADISIPIARKISDAIYVRIMDMVFNKRKIVLFKSKTVATPEENDKIKIQEKAFNNYLLTDLNLKEKMKFPTRQAVNSGTGIVKIVYETNNKPFYRFASSEEKYNAAVPKYSVPGTKNKVVKEDRIIFRGPNIYPVDRAKFVISSDALTIDDAYLVGFSFTKRKKQLDTLAEKEIYYKEAVDKLTAGKPGEVDEKRSASAGRDMKTTTYTEPYVLWELWLRYDVDEDGEEDDIVVTFHKESGEILKAIYNPIFYGYRPFVDFKGASQVEYTYDGEGICEIVEPISEEVDTLHNLMLDRMKLINLPIRLYQTGIGITDKDLEPGKDIPVDVDPQTAMFTVPDSNQTFSIMQEVNWLIGQADLVCGITPLSLGVSTTERPVAKETAMVGEEMNKKFKSWTDNFRGGYKELFYKELEAMAQYQPTYTYTDDMGNLNSVAMPTGDIRSYLSVDLEVSSEAMNQEIRREVSLMQYQLMSDYMTKVAGMAQLISNPQVPSDMKKFILDANDKGARAVERVMQNFDEVEAGQTTINMRDSMDVNKCVMQSVDLMPPPGTGPMGQGPQPGQGGPPQPPGPPPANEGLMGM